MELASRKKRARKALDGDSDAALPAAKRAKIEKAAPFFWREQDGPLFGPPRCDVCTDSDVVETPERDWVCRSCARCLSRYAAIDDARATFEERQETKADASSGVLSTRIEGQGRLVQAALRVDKEDATLEKRFKAARAIVADIMKHLNLHRIDSRKLAVRADALLRAFVVDAKRGLEKWYTMTWCKVALQCVLRAAHENQHSFLAEEQKAALHAVADTHERSRSFVAGDKDGAPVLASQVIRGVRCDDGKTVQRMRALFEADLKLPALSWTTIAHGFTARFNPQMCAKQQSRVRALIDWFAVQADNAEFNDKGTEKGQKGCRTPAAIRATAITLLQSIDSSTGAASDPVAPTVHSLSPTRLVG